MSSNSIVSIKTITKDWKDYKKVFRSKWVLIIFISVLFGLIGLTFTLLNKTEYKAKITFVLQEVSPQSQLNSIAGLASQLGLSAISTGSAFNQDNIIEILKSRNIIQKALLSKSTINSKDDYLINHYLKISNLLDDSNGKKVLFTNDTVFTYAQDSIMNIVHNNILKKNLNVSKLKNKLDIIEINVQSYDEQFSKLFAENLIKSITDFYVHTKTQRAREIFNFLQQRADSTKSALEKSEFKLAKWQDASNRLIKYEAQLERSKLFRNVEVLQVVYTEILKNLELSKMNLLNITPLIKIIDKPVIPLQQIAYNPFILALAGFLFGFLIVNLFLFIKMIIKNAIIEDKNDLNEGY